MTTGVDVSSHQSPARVPWRDLAAEGVEFMYARAGYGIGPDDTFAEHVARSRAGGVAITGAYHAFRPARAVLAQVDLLCSAMDRAGGDLFPVLDLEVRDGKPAADVAAMALEFCERVEARRGIRCALYSYTPFITGPTARLDASFAARPLILARYSRRHDEPVVPPPWEDWTIWQDDGTGGRTAPNGVDLDFNTCRMTAEQLRDVLFRPIAPPALRPCPR